MGVFDWTRGADTILDHVQIVAQTKNRLPLHPYDMVRRNLLSFFLACKQLLTDHDHDTSSISAASPLVGLALVLTHRPCVCSLLDSYLNGG